MIMDLILIIVLLAVLGTFAGGWRSGMMLPNSPAGVVMVLVIVGLIIALLYPHVPLYEPAVVR